MDVLIVEDDAALLAQLEDVLEDTTLAIGGASTAEAALALIESDGYPAILLTDINLGSGMDGVELASRLVEVQPALATIFISGAAHLVRENNLGARARFIRKPFRSAQLFAAISELRGLLDCEARSIADPCSAQVLA